MSLSKYEFKQNIGSMAFAYCRCSTDKQDTSINQQIKMCREYAEAHGYKLDDRHIYRDEGISGTNDERPAYRAMLYDVDMLRPAYIIVWKLDRLSRDNAELTRALDWLRRHGTQVISITEPSTGNMMVDMYLTGMAGISAQLYVMQLAENVRRGMNHRAENGLYNGSPIYGLIGKVKQPYCIDEATAPVVKRIFEEYAAGKPKRQIIDDLNSAGLRYITGKPFSISSISHILANRAYIGEYKWGAYVIPGGIPRIIDDDLFAKTQERTRRNALGGSGVRKKLCPDLPIADFELSEHAYCGYCGSTVHGKSGTSKTGAIYYYYVCKSRKHHKHCELKPKRKELLEEIVNEAYNELLQKSEYRIAVSLYCYNQCREQYAGNDAYIASLEAERETCRRKLQNIMRAIENGGYTSTLSDRIRELEAQIQQQSEAIAAEQARRESGPEFGTILKYFDSIVDKKAYKWDLIDRVVIYNDKIVLLFKFTSDPREIRIEEMSEMLANRKRIFEIFDKGLFSEHTPEQEEQLRIMLESMLADEEAAENHDFF